MRIFRALSTLLLLGAGTSATGLSCASKDDRSLGNSAGSGGSGARGGSGGSTTLAVTGGTTGSGGSSGSGTSGNAGAAGDDGRVSECKFAGLNCGGSSLEADLRTVNMLLLIDKSGSMTDSLGDGDKWTAMKSALAASLGRVASEMNFGLELFPYSLSLTIPEDDCGTDCFDLPDGDAAVVVPVGPGTDVVGEISVELEATKPGGGTPTAKALRSALEYFTHGAGAGLPGNNYVLLATDGGPNGNASLMCEAATCTTNLDGNCDNGNCCGQTVTRDQCLDDVDVLDALTALHDAGIPTFVVGLPGTDQYAVYLNHFAEAGGVPNSGDTKYYAVAQSQGVQGLTDVFNTITTQLVRSCDIPLNGPPTKTSLLNVAIDCTVIAPMSSDGSGWHLDDPSAPTEVILEGPVCDRLQTDGARRVDVIFGCPTVR
jgi:hypothetical protein